MRLPPLALPRSAGQPTLGVGRPDKGAADKKRMQMQIGIPPTRSTSTYSPPFPI